MLATRTCAGPGFTRCGSSLIVSAGDVKHPPELHLQASLIDSLRSTYLTLWGGNMPAWAYIGELQSSIENAPKSDWYSKGWEMILFPWSERRL